jgi:hemerythrin-like domain-containing protein
MLEATLHLILKQCEELRKYIRGVRTNVKTERSVIHDEIKTEESAVWNNVEDEKSIGAVSVGQEEFENRLLNKDRGQTGR